MSDDAQARLVRTSDGELEVRAPTAPTPVSARERTPFGNFQLRRSHLRTGPNPYAPGTPDASRFDAARRWPDVTAGEIPAHTLKPEVLRSVRLVVAGYAEDAEDLDLLLRVLGLVEEPEEVDGG